MKRFKIIGAIALCSISLAGTGTYALASGSNNYKKMSTQSTSSAEQSEVKNVIQNYFREYENKYDNQDSNFSTLERFFSDSNDKNCLRTKYTADLILYQKVSVSKECSNELKEVSKTLNYSYSSVKVTNKTATCKVTVKKQWNYAGTPNVKSESADTYTIKLEYSSSKGCWRITSIDGLVDEIQESIFSELNIDANKLTSEKLLSKCKSKINKAINQNKKQSSMEFGNGIKVNGKWSKWFQSYLDKHYNSNSNKNPSTMPTATPATSKTTTPTVTATPTVAPVETETPVATTEVTATPAVTATPVADSTDDDTTNYNREGAVAYALQYAEIPNTKYHTWSADCTNFVSQCLYEGGGLTMHTGTALTNSNWYYNTSTDRSCTWTGANNLRIYLLSSSSKIEMKVSDFYNVTYGDVIQLLNTSDQAFHSLIITDMSVDSSGQTRDLYVSCHSVNRKNVSLMKTWPNSRKAYYHIIGNK